MIENPMLEIEKRNSLISTTNDRIAEIIKKIAGDHQKISRLEKSIKDHENRLSICRSYVPKLRNDKRRFDETVAAIDELIARIDGLYLQKKGVRDLIVEDEAKITRLAAIVAGCKTEIVQLQTEIKKAEEEARLEHLRQETERKAALKAARKEAKHARERARKEARRAAKNEAETIEVTDDLIIEEALDLSRNDRLKQVAAELGLKFDEMSEADCVALLDLTKD